MAAIVSNHEDSRETAERDGIPFHHWPVTRETKAEQEAKLLKLVDFLEDLDDVQDVYTNADIAPEIMEALAG